VRRSPGVVFNFETGTYQGWTKTGTAFGDAPAVASIASQQPVINYEGNYFVNSFYQGSDAATGTLTSPEFILNAESVEFLIGGGQNKTTIFFEMVVEGKTVLQATGERSEVMRKVTWNVSPWMGKKVRFRIVDQSSQSWGHILVDDIRTKQTFKIPQY
jgi:hypothetical protein